MVLFFATAPWTNSSSFKNSEFCAMDSVVATSRWVSFAQGCRFARVLARTTHVSQGLLAF
jgi:hypothetical protein